MLLNTPEGGRFVNKENSTRNIFEAKSCAILDAADRHAQMSPSRDASGVAWKRGELILAAVQLPARVTREAQEEANLNFAVH